MFNIYLSLQEAVDIEDERLQSLKGELREEACRSIITAMNELNEYNLAGPMHEIWNFEAERKASFKEGLEFILGQIACTNAINHEDQGS